MNVQANKHVMKNYFSEKSFGVFEFDFQPEVLLKQNFAE